MNAPMNVLYTYPQWHTVSFSLVAKKHIEYLRRLPGLNIYEMDELSIPQFIPHVKYKLVIHPTFFIMHRVLESRRDITGRIRHDWIEWWKSHYEEVIGIDVCDSDAYSQYAIELLSYVDKFVVPSKFCVDVAKRSGVKCRVYYVPHGVDPWWYTMPNIWATKPPAQLNPLLLDLYVYKLKRNAKFILFWLWHSGERKGWPEVKAVYERIRQHRNDVVLILKTGVRQSAEFMQVMKLGAIEISGWLSDFDKMALYDLVDVTLLFSRGGSFELNCLEALARGTPCLANGWGPWTEYVPEWLRVRPGRRVQPLPGNTIHVGYGYAVDVDDAVEKLNYVLDHIEEFKDKVDEYRREVLSRTYRWDVIAMMLYTVLKD